MPGASVLQGRLASTGRASGGGDPGDPSTERAVFGCRSGPGVAAFAQAERLCSCVQAGAAAASFAANRPGPGKCAEFLGTVAGDRTFGVGCGVVGASVVELCLLQPAKATRAATTGLSGTLVSEQGGIV